MLYSSLIFIYCFFPVSLLIYRITPEKAKKNVLFLLSLAFFVPSGINTLVFMLAFTFFNYLAGLFTGAFRKKKPLSLFCMLVGIIFDFVSFFAFRTVRLSFIRESFDIPNGISSVFMSFMVLSAVGYLVDIYKKRIRAESSFIKFSLYIMMFSKFFIVIRYGSFVKMFNNLGVDISWTGKGLRVFVGGLVRKVIFADTMYMLYTAVKCVEVPSLSLVNAWLGMTAYMLCLYFTLSGFSEMGRGISLCFGFTFPPSFNFPLFSTKLRSFSSKWYIQIVQWFRRCFFRPLCENQKNNLYRRLVCIVAWCLIGIWYRADINGFLWGLLLGISITAERFFIKLRLPDVTGIIYTYVATMIFAVFLSGDDISHSFVYMLAMLGGNKVFIDSQTVYLIKCYGIPLIICICFSSGILKKVHIRNKEYLISALMPLITVFFLAVCTALISYSGSSEILIMNN